MIKVDRLTFSYTKKPFIQDMGFSVSEGEIFGFLGPSGAGKSTLQKILLGMLPNYQGSAVVNGRECKKHHPDFYESIGVDFEFSTMYEKLSARENLCFFSSLYQKQARSVDELLSMVGLENDADKRVSDYSKGMKSRLNFIKALLHDPKLLFLDEPTSGLDPTNSRLMKDMILAERSRGKTILLTTHNMQDATELCDRVAFIVGGQIFALDSPHNLIMSKGAANVIYTWNDNGEQAASCPLGQSGYFISRMILPAILALVMTVILLPMFDLIKWSVAVILLLSLTGSLQGIVISLLIVTLSSNKLEGMAVTKLSSFMMFGAIVPFFVSAPVDLCVCFLPPYWMGKAVYKGKPIVMLLSVLVAVIWILIVKRKYDRKM